MAAGWNAKLIVETWFHGGVIQTSVGLGVAAGHTSGRHVCIVPDERSRSAYAAAVSSSDSGDVPTEIIVGAAEEVIPELEGIDFLVVDGRRKDLVKVLRLARLSQRGAVLVCKNAETKTASCRWRGVVDGGRYRVVRTAFLPVGQGLDIAHVAASGGLSSSKKETKRRWIRHVDRSSGEEHVIRTT